MYITVRRYENASALAEAMVPGKGEINDLMSGIPGFVSYYATRDGDTMTSITICSDKAGCDESTRLAGIWVKENVKSLPDAPEVSGGPVFINF